MNSATHPCFVERAEDIRALLTVVRTIAVLGIETEEHAGQAAYYVPRYLQEAG